MEDSLNKPKMLSSTMLMASGTMVSRILGAIKVMLVGWIFTTTSRQVEMFTQASTTPSQIYLFLAGGVLNAILVPQLMRAMHRDEDGGQAYSDRIVTLFGLAVGGLTVAMVAATPIIMWVNMSSEWRLPEVAAQYRSLLLLTGLCLPQIFFYGMFFLGGQILNARDSFGPLMWAPVLNNVIQITMLATYAVVWGSNVDHNQPFTNGQVYLLGIGSVFGVACQALILIPYLKKVGFKYRPRFDFLHTGLGSTMHMAKWALALMVIDHISYLITNRLATTATAGGEGAGGFAFTTAMLISIMPHSLLTVSLATYLLPSLSRQAATADWQTFCSQFSSSIKLIYAAMIPVSLIMAAVAVPVCTAIWGVEDGGSYVGWTLAILSLGLIPFTLRFLVNKGFNSMENTRTPFFIEIIFVVVTCLVALVLVTVVKVPTNWVAPSIGLAYSLGYVASTVVSWRLLCRGVPGLTATRLTGLTVRLVALSTPGAVLATLVCWGQEWLIPGRFAQIVGVVVATCLGIGVYWGLAKFARVEEIIELETMVRSRLRKERPVETKSDESAVPAGSGEYGKSEGYGEYGQSEGYGEYGKSEGSGEYEIGEGADAFATGAFVAGTGAISGYAAGDGVTDGFVPAGEVPVGVPSRDGVPGEGEVPGRGADVLGEVVDIPGRGAVLGAGAGVLGASVLGEGAGVLGAGASVLGAGAGVPGEGAGVLGSVPAAPAEESPTVYLPAFVADETQPVLTGLAPLVPGALVGERYRLGELLGRVGAATRWSGTDEALSRPVFITAFANDPAAVPALEAARMASGAMDARFWRILDAGQDADGAFVVTERAESRTLSQILAAGPLSGEESAWVVREVAAGLASIHNVHLYHCRLDPSEVHITNAGAIRIAGLRVDQALTPRDNDDSLSRNDMQAMDVVACGALLYSCLTATWPGGAAIGLPPAPRNAEGLRSPAQVRPGTSMTLDRLTHRILSVSDAAHIGTAQGVVEALSEVLGSRDASAALAARALAPVAAPVVATPHGQAQRPVIVAARTEAEALGAEVGETTEAVPTGSAAPQPAPAAVKAKPLQLPIPVNSARTWSAVFLVLIAMVVIALITALIVGLYHSAQGPRPSPTPVLRPIVAAQVFDSSADGGDDEENNDFVQLAFDQDPTTSWSTEYYADNNYIPTRKPGVGLVFDLGTPVSISQITLTTDPRPVNIEVLVPGDLTATEPDMTTRAHWTRLTAASLTEATTTLDLTATTTRYVLVYITHLPPDGQANLAEVTLLG